MKLSAENQELLNSLYPEGYEVKENEKNVYHVLFIKIFQTKGRNNIVTPMVQKMNTKDWLSLKKQIDNGWTLSALTQHDELVVIHDPTKDNVKPVEDEPTVAKKSTVRTKSKPGPKPTT